MILGFLRQDVRAATYGLTLQRWFRKSFYEMEAPGKEGVISLPELKKFMQKVNCKIPNSTLKEKFREFDSKNTGDLYFDDFCSMFQDLVFSSSVFSSNFSQYTSDGKNVTLAEFQRFLATEQGQHERAEKVATIMRDFLADPSRNTQAPFFTATEFMDWLFSTTNTALSPKQTSTVYHDMTRPLSHYFISSSHNTYLTGDQIKSESSVEAYARCLRMGCRSIELDCWDGQDGAPFIYHGHTMTSKIKFLDVIKTIKDHAFVTSEFPVILSIEDHCSLPQQRKMATAFQDVFGDQLLVMPVDKNETELPSPERLKRKIILKHKKLPEGADESFVVMGDLDASRNMDLSDSVKNGILSVEEEGEWVPHFFVLGSKVLVYSELQAEEGEEQEEVGGEEREEEAARRISNGGRQDVDASELHFNEAWFHRNLPNGRSSAEQILKSCAALGDGTFLVRPSETFVGDYSLSFFRRGEVYHVPIKIRQVESGVKKFYLIDQMLFDSLFDLITHYQNHPLRSSKFNITLGKGATPPSQHEGKEWFRANTSRSQAEELLSRLNMDGVFLVRQGERVVSSFAVSFRAEGKVKHCLIKKDGRLYAIGTATFETLVELIAHYEKNPLYKKIKLRLPLTDELLAKRGTAVGTVGDHEEYVSSGYMDPASFTSTLCARAIHDYTARREDELTFRRDALITNVSQQEGGWWRGDFGGRRQHWFPANYTKVEEGTEAVEEAAIEASPLGSLQKGSIDIVGAKVDVVQADGIDVGIKIESPSSLAATVLRCASREEAIDWVAKLRETAQSASQRDSETRQRERSMKIARELSNLVIYCRSVPFAAERVGEGAFAEMSSFPETKAERLMCGPTGDAALFLKYHRLQFSRIYPKAQRVSSDNYSPVPMWGCGSQMVALNYQTGDKPMQINQAKFLDNGKCGYLLRPQFMFKDEYLPSDPGAPGIASVAAMDLTVRVMAARHLMKPKGMASPFVEVEVIGADYDNVKLKTKVVQDNGFNPVWDESFNLRILNPDLALIRLTTILNSLSCNLLRFCVYDEDMFGDPNFLGAATLPALCLLSGYRCDLFYKQKLQESTKCSGACS